MPKKTTQESKIKFGEVSFVSEEKGAFVKGLSEEKEEIFVSEEVIQSLRDQNQELRTGQMVQMELEGEDVKDIKPL
ncbi:MAG: hypothetical protein KAV87_60115 [Desulfobacteraceae bacterium]|nr:hypothetical protein [Desulfobacteraceae bacterium]